MRRISRTAAVLLLSVFLLSVGGCEAEPPKPQDLGRIVYDPAQIPGIDDTYQPPEPGVENGDASQQKPSEDGAPVRTP